MLVGIALCLTLLVMRPVWQEMYTEAYVPFEADQISLEQGLGEGKRIISQFMLRRPARTRWKPWLPWPARKCPRT